MLAPRRSSPSAAFPFGDARTEFFYLGRSAVFHAVRRLGLVGADVLVPAYHHGVEVEALVAAGARPVFHGIGRDLRTDLVSLEAALTPATRGLYVIHYAGFAQPMPELLAFARAHRLVVIEDCALSLLSASGGRPLGTSADASIFCLYKTLPVPHGGALWMAAPHAPAPVDPPDGATVAWQLASAMTTWASRKTVVGGWLRSSATRLASRFRRRRSLPVDAHPVGGRRFLEGQQDRGAAPFVVELARRIDAEQVVRRRRENLLGLAARLAGVHAPLPLTLEANTCPLFYPLDTDRPEKLASALAASGVETIPFWREGSRLCDLRAFPVVADLRRRVLELPIHQDVTAHDLDRMADVVRLTLAKPRAPKAARRTG
jgi:dTDP-4-amino-4,6-dideoxygalactose transaminase